MPRAATVAYAFAMSSGGTSAVPSVKDPHSPFGLSWTASRFCWSLYERNTMPRSSAALTAFFTVAFCSSWMKYVFTDSPKPDHIVCVPVIPGLALCGQYRSPQLAWPVL